MIDVNPGNLSAIAKAMASRPLLGAGEMEQLLTRLDQIADLLRSIEVNTRGENVAKALPLETWARFLAELQGFLATGGSSQDRGIPAP